MQDPLHFDSNLSMKAGSHDAVVCMYGRLLLNSLSLGQYFKQEAVYNKKTSTPTYVLGNCKTQVNLSLNFTSIYTFGEIEIWRKFKTRHPMGTCVYCC